MATLIIESSDPQNIKLIAELAKKLGDRIKYINPPEVEDILLGDLMDSVKTGECVDKDKVMKALEG